MRTNDSPCRDTIDEMWDDYRTTCCEPLDESNDMIVAQEMAFKSGVLNAVAALLEDPSRIDGLAKSIRDWINERTVGRN